jgi:hypothetical protein
MRFDKAAPNDEFPEGGLRISGCLPYPTAITQDNTNNGLAFAGGGATIGLNPCSAVATAASASFVGAGSPLSVFAQYFRRFRVRELEAEFESEVMPGVVLPASGAGLIVQTSFERDPVIAVQESKLYTQDTAVTADSTRFTVWESRVGIPLIKQMKSSPSDELFYCTGAGDSIATTSQAETRQVFQGAVTIVGSALQATTPLVVGKILWHFVVDLYGFTNIVAGVISASRRGLGCILPAPQPATENKEEKEVSRRPGPALSLVDSDYVRVDEDASRSASRSVSLRDAKLDRAFDRSAR